MSRIIINRKLQL